MSARRDYSCEIMAVIALTVLSALSHFWYILIASCVVAALAGAGYLVSSIFLRIGLRIGRELACQLYPARRKNIGAKAEVSIGIARGAGPSLPVARVRSSVLRFN